MVTRRLAHTPYHSLEYSELLLGDALHSWPTRRAGARVNPLTLTRASATATGTQPRLGAAATVAATLARLRAYLSVCVTRRWAVQSPI